MNDELKALESVRDELEKIKEKYQKKAEKERAKVNDVYVSIQGEKCRTEAEINEWIEADRITAERADRYIEQLIKKRERAGQKGLLTKSERVVKMLENTLLDYNLEIHTLTHGGSENE